MAGEDMRSVWVEYRRTGDKQLRDRLIVSGALSARSSSSSPPSALWRR